MSNLASATLTRLAALVTAGDLKHVGNAREFGRSLAVPPIDKMPAAFVLPYAETYGKNTLLNGVRQTGPEQITIVLMVAVKPAVGADVLDPFEEPRAALFTQLLGWQPDADQGAVLAVSGSLLEPRPTHLAYQFVFQRDHTERA